MHYNMHYGLHISQLGPVADPGGGGGGGGGGGLGGLTPPPPSEGFFFFFCLSVFENSRGPGP